MVKSISTRDIIEVLHRDGPLTGTELHTRLSCDVLELWRLCYNAGDIRKDIFGRRYLRLDRQVNGYARLSPSIRREFLTYTYLGLESQEAVIETKAAAAVRKLKRISDMKRTLAMNCMQDVIRRGLYPQIIADKVTFIIAGDVIYDMAHDVPRPESSTNQMVRGSDLDIIIVTENDYDTVHRQSLDAVIYSRKNTLLMHPGYREEIDYLIKDVSKVRNQLACGNFEAMVASKILWEGEYLCGNEDLCGFIKNLVKQYGVPEKMAALMQDATKYRAQAEESLAQPGVDSDNRFYNLFYTHAESDEIY